MTEQVDTQEQQRDEENAAMEAGFAEARGEDPRDEPKATQQAETTVETEAAPQETPTEPERNQYGFTHEEMLSLLNNAARVSDLEKQVQQTTQKIHGKLGEAFQTLKSLQETKSQAAGFNVELSEDDLDEELREQFPEMAKMQLNSLKRVLGKALGAAPSAPQAQSVQPAPAPVQQAPQVDPNIIAERIQQETEKRLLRRDHRDWEQVVQSGDFNVWKASQPAEVQNQLDNSWDADFLSEQLTAFKQWRTSAETARTTRSNRLEAAVTPQGVARTPQGVIDENAAMELGWKSVRGG